MKNFEKGSLILIGVPIGNSLDLSKRAIETFSQLKAVLCEDTRETDYLLKQINVTPELLSYGGGRSENAQTKAEKLINSGHSVGFVSDRGMPCVSDPGAKIIEKFRAKGVNIICIPGPSAVTTAFALSGYSGGFVFHGFLPRKANEIKKIAETLKNLDYNLIFFESPVRMKSTLSILGEIFGTRQATLAKELTKTNEKIIQGDLYGLSNSEFKGEYVIIIKRE